MGKGFQFIYIKDIKMDNMNMKRCLKSTIREISTKTTMRYDPTPVRMAIIKRQKIASAGKGTEKRERLYTVGGNVNWYSCRAKHYGASSKS